MAVRYDLNEHIQLVESAPRAEGILDQREITIQSYQTSLPFEFAKLDADLGSAWLSPTVRLGVFSRSSSSQKNGCSAVLGLQDRLTVRAYNYEKRTPLWYSWKDVIVETAAIRYYRGSDGLLWFITTGGGRRITEEKLAEFNSVFLGIPVTAVTKQVFDLAKLRELCFNRFVSRLYMVRFTDPSGKAYRSIDHALFQSREYIDPEAPCMQDVRADEQVKIESFDSDIEVRCSDLDAPVRVRFFIRGLSGALRLRFPRLVLKGDTRKPDKQAEAFYRIVNATRDSILDANYYQENQESLEVLHGAPDLFPETVDLSMYRKVLNRPDCSEKFFAGINLNAPKAEWGPHLLALDQLVVTDAVRVHVEGLVGDLGTDRPLMAAKFLDECRTDARLSRLGAVAAAGLCAKLHEVPAETRAQVEGAFLLWAVAHAKDGWDVDADTGDLAVLKWRGRLESMVIGLRSAVLSNLMDRIHAKLAGTDGDVGPLLKKFNWCVATAKTLPSDHADCPVSLRLIIEGMVPACIGDGNKVLKEPVNSLEALDEGVLKHFGLALWPFIVPQRQNGKIVLTNGGCGTAQAMHVMQAGELPGVGGAPCIDLWPGKEMSVPAVGNPTSIEVRFSKFGRDFRATLPVIPAHTATGVKESGARESYPEAAKLDAIMGEVKELKGAVVQSVDATQRVRAESERRKVVIEEMAEGADKFLAGMRARITEPENLNLFMCLLEKTAADGQERYLSYAEIGGRLDGVTKQAVGARVNRFKGKYPEVWDYVDALRNPEKTVVFSEMAPSERRKSGIDESYNYDAR